MIRTHKGHAEDAHNKYVIEVLKEGHVRTIVVEKNRKEIARVWCEDKMTAVHKYIRQYVGSKYTLEKCEGEERLCI